MKRVHKQVSITIHGKKVSVDEGVHDLILRFNRLPGIRTYHSCQAEEGGEGYVQFGGAGVFRLLPALAAEILRQEKLWKRNHRHVCWGCEGMSVHLEICGNGTCLRWSPWDYQRLLSMVERLSRPAAKNPRV